MYKVITATLFVLALTCVQEQQNGYDTVCLNTGMLPRNGNEHRKANYSSIFVLIMLNTETSHQRIVTVFLLMIGEHARLRCGSVIIAVATFAEEQEQG